MLYNSGDRSTQVHYMMCRWCNLKEIGDCKVLTGESVVRQRVSVVVRRIKRTNKETEDEIVEG